ncbi:integrase core domain-containing protein [Paracoccus marcusii]|uniref:integrase core domain-containing protein n=1 Tax=Paracoccus marcusii TaxID=59779 RepID=UPI0038D1EA6F
MVAPWVQAAMRRQGSQFTSFAWTGRLRRSGVRISMDGKGVRKRTLDNTFIERLWRALKYECVHLHAWETGLQARTGVRDWMEFHNHRRPHNAPGNRPPAVVCSDRRSNAIRSAGPDQSSKSARSRQRNGEHISEGEFP